MTQKVKLNDTIRRYPRTMDEAFGFGPEYGESLTRYKRVGRWSKLLTGLFIAMVILLFFVGFWRRYAG